MKIAVFKLGNEKCVVIPYAKRYMVKADKEQIELQFNSKVTKYWIFTKELMENQATDIIKNLDINKSFEEIREHIKTLRIKVDPKQIFGVGDKVRSNVFGIGEIKQSSKSVFNVLFPKENEKLYNSKGLSINVGKIDKLRRV